MYTASERVTAMGDGRDDEPELTPPPSTPVRLRRAAKAGVVSTAVVVALGGAVACGDSRPRGPGPMPPMIAPMVEPFDAGSTDGGSSDGGVTPDDAMIAPMVAPDAGGDDAGLPSPMPPPSDGGGGF